MKTRILPVFFVVFSLFFVACPGTSNELVDLSTIQNFTLTIPTAEEEATLVMGNLRQISWFDSMGYHITLPNTALFNDAIRKLRSSGSLTSQEEAQIRTHYINDVYDPAHYEPSFNTLARAARDADPHIDSLRRYESLWGFFIPNRYRIYMTQYGPGGSYNSNAGAMYIKVDRNNRWGRGHGAPMTVLLHEAVHIGIENNIIQRNNIPQWTKERIVDSFMLRQFGTRVLPGYSLQRTPPEYPIDSIFQNSDVLDKLPDYVSEFMRQNR